MAVNPERGSMAASRARRFLAPLLATVLAVAAPARAQAPAVPSAGPDEAAVRSLPLGVAADDATGLLPGAAATDAAASAQTPPRPMNPLVLLLATLAMIAIAAAGIALTLRALREDRQRRRHGHGHGHRHRTHRDAAGSASR